MILVILDYYEQFYYCSLDAEQMYLNATKAVVSKLKDPEVVYMVERLSKPFSEVSKPVILRGTQLDFNTPISNIKLVGKEASQDSDSKILTCAHFCLESKSSSTMISLEVKKKIM